MRDESGRMRSRAWWRVPLVLWWPGPAFLTVHMPAGDDLSGVEPVEEFEVEPGFEDDLSDVEPVEESL